MCTYTSSQQQEQEQAMVNPYKSYCIHALLPSVASKVDLDSCEDQTPLQQLSPQLTISICSDNARSLSAQESMTMRSLLKQPAVKMCRWSSVPDLIEKSLSVARTSTFSSSSSSNSRSASRSTEDLRSLMLNNSRIPRSTDDLKSRSKGSSSSGSGSFQRSKNRPDSVTERQNDRWDLQKPNRSSSKPKNPFDLRMLPLSGLGTRATTTNVAPSLPVRPSEKIKPSPQTHSLKIPQRRRSAEVKDLSDPNSALQKFLRNLNEEGDEDSSSSHSKEYTTGRGYASVSAVSLSA